MTAEGKVLLLWDGTNDQEVCGGAYASLSDDDEDALIMTWDPQGQNGRVATVSDWTSDQRYFSCLRLFTSRRRRQSYLAPNFRAGGNTFLRTNL